MKLFLPKLRAFTMVEVLVSLVIISLLTVGGLMMSRRYVLRGYWDELFQKVEQEFFTTNVYALAGVSAQGLDEAVLLDENDLPEMHHLYFQTGSEGLVWYVETRQEEGTNKREVIYASQVDFDLDFFNLSKLELYDIDPEGGEEFETTGVFDEAVLLTWTGPLAQLTFHFLPNALVSGSNFSSVFSMPDEPVECLDGNGDPENCLVKLTFEDNADNKKAIFIDLQKGVYRDFY